MPDIDMKNPEQLKEYWKWEQRPSAITYAMHGIDPSYSINGGNFAQGGTKESPVPYTAQEYPRMVYRAERRPNGDIVSFDPVDPESQKWSDMQRERWNENHCKLVNNDSELEKAEAQGWRKTQVEAMEVLKAKDREESREAAERAYRDRNMSEAAQREAALAEASSHRHLAEIPEKPKAPKRAYRRKIVGNEIVNG